MLVRDGFLLLIMSTSACNTLPGFVTGFWLQLF